MKICLIGNAQAVHLQRWAGAYADRGHDVHVVSIRACDMPNITVHTRNLGQVNTTSPVWTALSYLWLTLGVRRLVGSIDPDVVHAQFVTTSGVMARVSGNDHIVLTAWGSDVIPPHGSRHNFILRALNRWALNGARRVTSASTFMSDQIASRYGVSAVRLVPFGVDTDRFFPVRERSPGPLRLGVVKSLNKKYGIDDAISALAAVRETENDATLVIAGDGPLRPSLEQHAAGLGLADAVSFLGRVPHGDVPGVLRDIDIFLNTSVVPESFGVAILEAEASGLPVVATDVGGVAETCSPGESAFLVEPNDPEALAAAVLNLTDESMRSSFGQAGRALVENRFTWERSVSDMLNILEEVRKP